MMGAEELEMLAKQKQLGGRKGIGKLSEIPVKDGNLKIKKQSSTLDSYCGVSLFHN